MAIFASFSGLSFRLATPAYVQTEGSFPSCFLTMKISLSFRPKLAETLKHYTRQDFAADFAAGITVGIVALPLAMALAIASGMKPEVGLFTAIIGGILISL